MSRHRHARWKCPTACGLLVGFVLMALHTGCGGLGSTRTDDPNAVRKWVHDPAHGVSKTKEVGTLKLRAEWLPPALCAHDLMATLPPSASTDSLLRVCQQQVHLVLTLSPPAAHPHADVMKVGIDSRESYTDRMVNLNFHSEEHGQLKVGALTLAPLGALMENTYGLRPDRDIHFLFGHESWGAQGLPAEFTFEYDDTEYGTGHHLFRFHLSDMKKAPQLTL